MTWQMFMPALSAAVVISTIVLGALWRIGKWFGATQAQAGEFIKEIAEVKSDLTEIKADQKETKESIVQLRLENARRDGIGKTIDELKDRVHALEAKRA